MKQIKFIKTSFLMLLMFGSIGQIFSQTKNVIRIDPDKAYGGSFSEYFESVEYIPLETTKESLFGFVSKMIITDSSIVVFDDDTKSILFFSLKGKFLNKISKKNNQIPNTIFFDYTRNQVVAICVTPSFETKGIDFYYLNGAFASTEPINKNLKDKMLYATYLDKNVYTIYNKPYDRKDNLKNKDSLSYIFNIYNKSQIQKIIPYNRINNLALLKFIRELPMFNNPPMHDGSFYFSTPLENMVYKINKDGAEKMFQFIFPAKSQIGQKLLQMDNEPGIDSIISKRNWFKGNTILNVSNIVLNQDRLMFKINTGSFGFPGPGENVVNRNFIYDLKSGKLSAIERITPDASTFFLPFIQPEIVSFKGFSHANGYLYTQISSLKMFQEMEATKAKNPKYSTVLQKYFNTQNRKSNPVMVRFKLKE